jgi:hypothetical protein
MTLGYLALLVAEIPKWIAVMVNDSEIDFATFEHFEPKTTGDLLKHFDENFEAAKKALQNGSDAGLSEPFYLKNQGQIVTTNAREDRYRIGVRSLTAEAT